eukprot:1344082-Amorphochlora_amoeboformis.AAC.1
MMPRLQLARDGSWSFFRKLRLGRDGGRSRAEVYLSVLYSWALVSQDIQVSALAKFIVINSSTFKNILSA